MHPLRRVRIAFATRRFLYWSLVATVSVGAGWYVQSRASALDHARARLGTRRDVVVAAHPLAPGDAVVPSDVRIVGVPLAFAPPEALGTLPPGATATAPIDSGEIITPARVGSGRSPLAALVPPDRRAVAVARGDHRLPLRAGDRVDVVSMLTVVEGAGPQVVARDALVVAVDDSTVVIAVAAEDEAAVAGAVASTAITLALAG